MRFLSNAGFLTPLKRDLRIGRPIWDGLGGYEIDIEYGVRVIKLGRLLREANLVHTDLRGVDLSDANLINANLQGCDLRGANLCRSLLNSVNLGQANLSQTRLFYGHPETAMPRDRLNPPNFETGERTGAVIEQADFTDVQGLSAEQRYYCCTWGDANVRATIPGGCDDIRPLSE